MFKWLKKLFTKKQKYVTNREIKEIYKNFSKNQLIRVINTLATENAILKNKRQMYYPKVIEKEASKKIIPEIILKNQITKI